MTAFLTWPVGINRTTDVARTSIKFAADVANEVAYSFEIVAITF
jgi:hypothetical protein